MVYYWIRIEMTLIYSDLYTSVVRSLPPFATINVAIASRSHYQDNTNFWRSPRWQAFIWFSCLFFPKHVHTVFWNLDTFVQLSKTTSPRLQRVHWLAAASTMPTPYSWYAAYIGNKISNGFIESEAHWGEAMHNNADEPASSQRRSKTYTGFLSSTAYSKVATHLRFYSQVNPSFYRL